MSEESIEGPGAGMRTAPVSEGRSAATRGESLSGFPHGRDILAALLGVVLAGPSFKWTAALFAAQNLGRFGKKVDVDDLHTVGGRHLAEAVRVAVENHVLLHARVGADRVDGVGLEIEDDRDDGAGHLCLLALGTLTNPLSHTCQVGLVGLHEQEQK